MVFGNPKEKLSKCDVSIADRQMRAIIVRIIIFIII